MNRRCFLTTVRLGTAGLTLSRPSRSQPLTRSGDLATRKT